MLRICLCDDEKGQRRNLNTIISTQMELRGIDYTIVECQDGDELIGLLHKDKHYCDMIFLDIEMKKMNGIDTAKAIRCVNGTVVIIFVTGFADYVFDGYDVKALNYVLKPYRKEKIIEVLSQALEHMGDVRDKFYVVQTKKSAYKLNVKDILYFASNKRKIKVVTENQTFEFYEKLDVIEEELPTYYIRIHLRYLVNLNHVTSIEHNVLKIGDKSLPISRSRYHTVMITFAKLMLG